MVPLFLCGLVSPVAENPVVLTSTSTIVINIIIYNNSKQNSYYHYDKYP